MIPCLVGAGFRKCNVAGGKESYLGAWSMDCAWHALRQWHGIDRRDTLIGVLGNHYYFKAAPEMARVCGVGLITWTRDLDWVSTADEVGNIIETYATLLVRDGGWDEMCSLLRYLARSATTAALPLLPCAVAGGPPTARSTTTDASPPPPCAAAGTPRRRVLLRLLRFRPQAPPGCYFAYSDFGHCTGWCDAPTDSNFISAPD